MPAGQPCDVFATCQNMCVYVFCRRGGEKTLGPFANLSEVFLFFFLKGLCDTFTCVLLLKRQLFVQPLRITCHVLLSERTHTSVVDTSERLRLSPVNA